MQVSIELDRKGKPSIKTSVDWATGTLITNLSLPVTMSPQDLADLATLLKGDLSIQVVFTNPQLELEGLFQNTNPGSSK